MKSAPTPRIFANLCLKLFVVTSYLQMTSCQP